MALLRSPSSVTVTDLVLLPDRSKDAEGRCREDRRHPSRTAAKRFAYSRQNNITITKLATIPEATIVE